MTDAILAATRRRSAALVARDPVALRALHHPGFRFTTPRGDVRLVEHDIVVHGDTAVLTGVVHDAFERAGEPGAHDMRLTLVWVKQDGEWVVLAAHAGPPV